MDVDAKRNGMGQRRGDGDGDVDIKQEQENGENKKQVIDREQKE